MKQQLNELMKQLNNLKQQMATNDSKQQMATNDSKQQMAAMQKNVQDMTQQKMDEMKKDITQQIQQNDLKLQQKMDILQQKMDDCCDSMTTTSSSNLDDFKQQIKNRLMHILFKQLIKNKLGKLIGTTTVSPPTTTSTIPFGVNKPVSNMEQK
jgi:hypothetical protein